MAKEFDHLPYNPEKLPRELKKFYLSASDTELKQMLEVLKLKKMDDLFKHIPDDVKFTKTPNIGKELSYEQLIKHVEQLAKKNNPQTCFIGDGLKNYKVHEIIPFVSNIRGLTTAYTPYQPERSQGTLWTLWMYSSCLSMLTGFEAINASFYERSTCLHEALNTALRLKRNSSLVLVCESIYPGDIEVLKSLAIDTPLEIQTVPVNPKTGQTDLKLLSEMAHQNKDRLGAIAFAQVNNFGVLEDVHALTDLCSELNVSSVALIDPFLLSTGGLIAPSEFGSKKQGASMIVGEGQHLAIGPNFGGPGLGIFGIRYNQQDNRSIRQTAGRYVGKTKDAKGNEALCMILSTREQHIRREKATSNICSNQSFVASLAGAGMLARGEKGMSEARQKGYEAAKKMSKILTSFEGVSLAFSSPSYNEFTLELPVSCQKLIQKAREAGLHLGVDVSERVKGDRNLLLLSFFDVHEQKDLEKLESFFASQFKKKDQKQELPAIEKKFLRQNPANLPQISTGELKEFYQKLGALNVSPDDSIYPLGSCTMKYNPYINDYAASLPGFTNIHPQAPLEDAQGCLEILYEIQEMFKAITGLPAVTTQPVAGAQGELVGLKMFQAYHRDKGEDKKRNIILIPRSAHGTNPATATMAGFETKKVGDQVYGIVTIEADSTGHMDFNQLEKLINEYNTQIAGVMVTNPNTSGIFETRFKEMSALIHKVGGLVYMDGANMNAIASWVDLNKLGVDAVHNNLHKTWTIPHGGGGPGDAIVAVSEKLKDFLPGIQVVKENNSFTTVVPKKSMGSIHRHFGNFAHKVRAYTYLKALGSDGVKKMSAVATLSACYLYHYLKEIFPTLPQGAHDVARMHEFIITLAPESFARIQEGGTAKAQAIARVGKLFLDFGLHAPTVAFPEVYGLMIEPTESFSKKELDDFIEVLKAIHHLIHETPEILTTTPHFTPVAKVDEVAANKDLHFYDHIKDLPKLASNVIEPGKLRSMKVQEICQEILKAHQKAKSL